jgi:NCS1 family nucleobase:cation symporter-1
MCMEITTYQLASSLIAKGMDWKQALGTVLLGNLIVLVPMLLNAHAGAKYGIPFPVFIRAPFGVRGANLAAMLRAVVACGWFGIQSWIGGRRSTPCWRHLAGALRPRRLVGVLPGLLAAEHGRRLARRRIHPPLQAFGAPFMFVMAAALLIWVRIKAGSFGAMLSTPSQFHSTHEFLAVFFPSLTAMVGYWATLALNIPDFTRYSKSQSPRSRGDRPSDCPWRWCSTRLSASRSLLLRRCCSAAHLESDRADRRVSSAVVAFVALIAILVATLNVNIGANVVSPSNDFSNLYPRLISFAPAADHRISRPGDVPVEAAGHAGRLHFRLAGGLLGPARARRRHHGVRLLFIRGTELDVNSLYHREGIYYYTKGVNPRAMIALVLGVADCVGRTDRVSSRCTSSTTTRGSSASSRRNARGLFQRFCADPAESCGQWNRKEGEGHLDHHHRHGSGDNRNYKGGHPVARKNSCLDA